MRTRSKLQTLTGIVALATAGGLASLAAPAEAATLPTTTLSGGSVVVTGTAFRDLIHVTIDSTRLVVDLGFDGTTDAVVQRNRFQSVKVLGVDGDDSLLVDGSGVGDLPIKLSGGNGNDFVGVIGNIGDLGVGDQQVGLNGDAGNDSILAAAPGPVTIQGGSGDDRVDGGGAGTGREVVILGDGNDRFTSSLNGFVSGGTRTDIVDGGAGRDAMEVDGTFASESVSLSNRAGHLLLTHELRNTVDSDNVEDVSWFGFGGLDGGDQVVVNDLSGTDVVTFTPHA